MLSFCLIDQVCDFIVDCKGGDDERSCGNCTFDEKSNQLCGWTDVSKGIRKWMLSMNGTTERPGQGPAFDHTTYSSRGKYMYLTSNNGSILNAPARLITPVLREASSTCILEFWAYIIGSTSHQLQVTLLTGNQIERAILQRFHYETMYNWTKFTIEVGRIDVPFQLAFDSQRSTNIGWVAIDDTKILRCHLPPIVNASQCQGPTRYQCARGSCISNTRICDLTDDCGDHSDESSRLCASYRTCTFDVSFCDWRHDNTTEFKWELLQGASPSEETGVCHRDKRIDRLQFIIVIACVTYFSLLFVFSSSLIEITQRVMQRVNMPLLKHHIRNVPAIELVLSVQLSN
jgi:hypothetical protein